MLNDNSPRKGIHASNYKKANYAVHSNFLINEGVIVKTFGQEAHDHLTTTYQVRLVDTGHIISCRSLSPYASFDGCGVIYPLEEGDPVLIAYKDGLMQNGIILGCPYHEGDYEKFCVRGQGLKPLEVDEEGLQPREANQPSIHPNRIAQPDSYFFTMGGKDHIEPFHDPAIAPIDVKERSRKRSQPSSIEFKNRLGDCVQWSSGDQILVSNSDVIILANSGGRDKCRRYQELEEYYTMMADELEKYVGKSSNTDPLSRENSINEETLQNAIKGITGGIKDITDGTTLIDDTNRTNTLLQNSFNQNVPTAFRDFNEAFRTSLERISTPDEFIEREVIRSGDTVASKRLLPYVEGEQNIDSLQWAPLIEYHIPQLRKLAESSGQLAKVCLEQAAQLRNIVEMSSNAMNSSNNTQCTINSDESIIDKAKALSGQEPCKKGDIIHFSFSKWKANESNLVRVDGQLVQPALKEAYLKMKEAARKDNVEMRIVSGYRGSNYNNRTCDSLSEERLKEVAPATHSEHITGYAVDILGTGTVTGSIVPDYSGTPNELKGVWKWMHNNVTKYGFEISFGHNNKQGVAYEPWHIRYIGKDLPTELATMFALTRKGNSTNSEEAILSDCKEPSNSVQQVSDIGSLSRGDLDLDQIVNELKIHSIAVVITAKGSKDSKILVSSKGKEPPTSAASVIKLAIASTVINELIIDELNKGVLDPASNLLRVVRGVVGYRENFSVGSSLTISKLCQMMLEESSNTATNVLVHYLGGPGNSGINPKIKSIGYNCTKFNRYLNLPGYYDGSLQSFPSYKPNCNDSSFNISSAYDSAIAMSRLVSSPKFNKELNQSMSSKLQSFVTNSVLTPLTQSPRPWGNTNLAGYKTLYSKWGFNSRASNNSAVFDIHNNYCTITVFDDSAKSEGRTNAVSGSVLGGNAWIKVNKATEMVVSGLDKLLGSNNQ